MAIRLVEQGCFVTITDVNEQGLIETKRMVHDTIGSDTNIIHAKCDVSDLNSVKESARIAKEKFGPVTILINNAGIVSGK